ncbi:hypothetical protein ACM66B_002715 [Microbotryomycetes sp. NB124-2]
MADAPPPPPNKLVKKSFFARARPDWSRKSLSGDEHGPSTKSPRLDRDTGSSALRQRDDGLPLSRFENDAPAVPRFPEPRRPPQDAGASSVNSAARTTASRQLLEPLNYGTESRSDVNDMAQVSSTVVIDALVRRFTQQVRAHASAIRSSHSLTHRVMYSYHCLTPIQLPHMAIQRDPGADSQAETHVLGTHNALLDITSQETVEHLALLLVTELEGIAKPLDAGLVSLDVLRSQALLLSTLAACLFKGWARVQTATASKEVVDPVPLPDRLASQLLTLATAFLRNNLQSSPTDVSPTKLQSAAPESTPVSIAHFCRERLRRADDMRSRQTTTVTLTRNQARTEIVQDAFQIVFYLSASNWTLVHAFLVSKYTLMSKKDGGADPNDVKVLEGCLLTRLRLSMIIQDLSVTFSSIKKQFQSRVLTALYSAIWSFIESFPQSFSALQNSHRRIEGGPDVLFDVIYGSMDKIKGQQATHLQTLSMLLVLCPDFIARFVISKDLKALSNAKKATFLSSLKTIVSAGEDVSTDHLTCGRDVLLAASITEPEDRDPCSLRMLAADMQDDLLNRVFSPSTGALLLSNPTESDLAVRILVSMYRFDPLKTIEAVFRVHLLPSVEGKTKLVALRACEVIVREETSDLLPSWTPPSSALVPATARLLREIFVARANVSNESAQNGRPSPVRQAQTQAQSEETMTRDEVISLVVKVWLLDYRFLSQGLFVPPINAPSNQPGSNDTLSRICLVLARLLRYSQSPTVRRTVAQLLSAIYERQESNVLHPLDKQLSAVTATSLLCAHAIESWHSPGEIAMAYELVLRDLQQHHLLMRSLPANIIVALSVSSQLSAMYTLLQIAIILGRAIPTARAKTLECLKLVPLITAYVDSILQTSTSSPPALPSALRFLNVLARDLNEIDLVGAAGEVATSGVPAAWCEMCRRQQEVSQKLTDGVSDSNAADTVEEWSSLTGSVLDLVDTVTRAKPITLNLEHLPSRFSDATLPAQHVGNILTTAVRPLFENDQAIRNASRVTISEHLDIVLLSNLVDTFAQLEDQLKGNDQSLLNATTEVLDIAAMVLRKRQSFGHSLDSSSLPIFVLAALRRYRESSPIQQQELRINACAVLVALHARATRIESKLRFSLLEELMRPSIESQSSFKKLEAAFGTAQAVATLLSDATTFPAEQQRRPAIWLRRMIDAVQVDTDQETDEDVFELLSQTRQHLIEALSRLVAAGPSASALIDSLDLRTELDLWLCIAKRGFPSTRHDNDLTAQQQLVQLVQRSPALPVAMSRVVSPAKYDELVETLIQVLGTRQAMSSFLRTIIQEEVDNTEHEATLFRGNSFATRLMTVYARARGYAYLRRTLGGLILQLCERPSQFVDELDPGRRSEDDEATSSSELESVTEAFLHTISASVADVPPEIRDICLHVAVAVGTKFPESVFTSIGGFLFLRFINPAIISPETIDIALPLNEASEARHVRKNLVMISKVLQSLSNNVRFGLKDPSLRKLNAFMDVQVFTMANFLQRVSQPCPSFETARPFEEHEVASEAVDSICYFVRDDAERIYAELQAMAQAEPLFSNRLHSVADKLNGSLVRLTREDCSDTQADDEDRLVSDERLEAFVANVEHRGRANAGDWEHVFYETAASKQQTPTWCLALSLLDFDRDDLDSLAAVVLSTLSLMDTPYELLVDATGFERCAEFDASRFAHWLSMLKPPSLDLLTKIIVATPNSAFRDLVVELARGLPGDSVVARKLYCEIDWKQLDSRYYNIDVILPTRSVELYRDHRINLAPTVVLVETFEARPDVPVSLSLGPSSLSIQTERPVPILGESTAALLDYWHLYDIEEITCRQSDGAAEFALRRQSSRRTRRFRCDSLELASDLIEVLQAACTEAREKSTSTSTLFSSNLLAISIVKVLQGSSSTLHSQRRSAQALLGVLISPNAGGSDATSTLAVPSYSLTSVVTASEQLAMAHAPAALPVLLLLAETALRGVSPRERQNLIHAMRPWVYNVGQILSTGRDQRGQVLRDFRRLIRFLFLLSVRSEADMITLCSRVWPVLGKLESLIPLVLDLTLDFALHTLPQFHAQQIACSSLLALNATSSLRPKLLARIRQLLARTALRPPRDGLETASGWPEISLLVRIDAELSYLDNVQLFLPDLVFVVSTIAGCGDFDTRAAARTMIVNAVHALSQAGASQDPETVGKILQDLAQTNSHFALGQSLNVKQPTWDPLVDGATLCKLLSDLLEAAAPCTDAANAWRARWTSLVMTTCFQHNPAVQERQFVALSFLGSSAIDSDLVYQVITSLRSALLASDEQEQPSQLVLVILRALVTTLPALADNSQFWPALASVAISLIQIGWPRLDAAAVPLLTVILERMEHTSYFQSRTVGDVVNEWRAEADDTDVFDRLDSNCGVSFSSSFSYSMAKIMHAATRGRATRATATTLLHQLIKYTRVSKNEPVSAVALPFFLLLLLEATESREDMTVLLSATGFDAATHSQLSGSRLYDEVVSRTVIDNEAHVTLALAFVLKLARDANTDEELLLSLCFLTHWVLKQPRIASGFLKDLHTLVNLSLAATNLDVLSAVHRMIPLLQALPTSYEDRGNATLDSLGFHSLTSSWDNERAGGSQSLENVELVCELLATVLDRPL